MILLAHTVAILCYIGAAALAAAPIARPVVAPVRWVRILLGLGVGAHLASLASVGRAAGHAPVTGLGPALSFAGLLLAAMLLVVALVTRDISVTLAAAPVAAVTALAGAVVGLHPPAAPSSGDNVWVIAPVALSFAGLAAVATSAAAGVMYIAQHRQLKARHFDAMFRFFPPLDTLDRMNHWGVVAGWLGLTVGTVLAMAYGVTHSEPATLKLVWGTAAWAAATALAFGRVWRGWQARRAAVATTVAFASIVVLYLLFRFVSGGIDGGRFL
ncbi:MAG: hypothetical protein NVS1B4_07920 [Gemmatimonadaceae bacterium]